MTVYVLGAGASLHAGCPPAARLGKDLHSWIRWARPCGDPRRECVELCADTFGGLADLERVLTELENPPQGSAAEALCDAQRRNARQAVLESIPEFFSSLRARDSSSGLYCRFARSRVRPGDVIITCNYDLACERALKGARLWEIGEGYGFSLEIAAMPASAVKVLKLHGSTNWWWPASGGPRGPSQGGPQAFPHRPVLLIQEDFSFLGYGPGPRDPKCPTAVSCAAFPALIVPTREKRFYARTTGGTEQREFWDELWRQAGEALENAEDAVVIGYSMPLADGRARDLLLNRPRSGATTTVACAADSASLRNEFVSHGFSRVQAPGDGRFESCLGESAEGGAATREP